MDKKAFNRVAVTYLLFFIIYRFLPNSILAIHWQPTPEIHVHHYFYGVIIIVVAGFVRLVYPDLAKNFLAIMYGFGLFLVLDQITMLFKFREDTACEYLVSIIMAIIFLMLYTAYRIKKSP